MRTPMPRIKRETKYVHGYDAEAHRRRNDTYLRATYCDRQAWEVERFTAGDSPTVTCPTCLRSIKFQKDRRCDAIRPSVRR